MDGEFCLCLFLHQIVVILTQPNETAITDPWRKHYKMFSYVTVELVEAINVNFSPSPGKQSIFGHSMGGHGALICALRNPGMYKSVSAFAPISNPKLCPWGEKAFTGYLGDDNESWNEWDATELVGKYKGPALELFIDQVKGIFASKQFFRLNNNVTSFK